MRVELKHAIPAQTRDFIFAGSSLVAELSYNGGRVQFRPQRGSVPKEGWRTELGIQAEVPPGLQSEFFPWVKAESFWHGPDPVHYWESSPITAGRLSAIHVAGGSSAHFWPSGA